MVFSNTIIRIILVEPDNPSIRSPQDGQLVQRVPGRHKSKPDTDQHTNRLGSEPAIN